MLHTEKKTVPINAVRMNDRRFIISFGNDNRVLQHSIRKTGLLNPPHLVFDPETKSYIIVCGFRRLTAAAELGWHDIPANIISSPVDYATLQIYSLQDNLSHRRLNIVEKACAAAKLITFLPEKEVISAWLPLMECSAGINTLLTLQAIARGDQDIHEAVLDGTITEKTAAALCSMDEDSRRALYSLFTRIHLSASKQREVTDSCNDLARRLGTSINSLLTCPDIKKILDNRKASRSQKGDAVLSVLRKKRSPVLSAQGEKFHKLKTSLNLPQNVSLSPPPRFEGNTFRIELTFGSADEFADTVTGLQHIAAREGFRDFIDKK